ncbi:MAG: hypothetical protein ACRDV4_04130 [Acidimicrobiales bacterium]
MRTADPVTTFVERYRPKDLTPKVTCFAKALVAAAAPTSPTRAKALLFASSRLGAFCVANGVELDPTVLLREAVIERFVATGTDGLSHATKRTLRSNLLALKRALPDAGPKLASISRERAKLAYTDKELSDYLALARAQPTLCRRMHAVGLVCLGAGAGLVGGDLRAVAGTDVVVRSGGVLVYVAGRRPRVVPVLACFADTLLEAARFAQNGFVVGGAKGTRRNITTPLISSLCGGVDLDRLDVGRLRASWLSKVAALIGLPTFMAAAGITCSQRLGDVVGTIATGDEAQAVALLGARR